MNTKGRKAEKTLLSPSTVWIEIVDKTKIKDNRINIFFNLKSLKKPIKKNIYRGNKVKRENKLCFKDSIGL